MNQEFLNQLEQWNQEEQYQKIIDAVEALPEGELDFNLISTLRSEERRVGKECRL